MSLQSCREKYADVGSHKDVEMTNLKATGTQHRRNNTHGYKIYQQI
jgi:hypothetical protein